MFKLLKKKPVGSTAEFKVDGMNCASCGLNIDGTLKEIAGIKNSHTNHADGKTVVEYDSAKVKPEAMMKAIAELGYEATQVNSN